MRRVLLLLLLFPVSLQADPISPQYNPWFDSTRIHLHTRLVPNGATFESYNSPRGTFSDAQSVAKRLGASVVVRAIKFSDEPAFWYRYWRERDAYKRRPIPIDADLLAKHNAAVEQKFGSDFSKSDIASFFAKDADRISSQNSPFGLIGYYYLSSDVRVTDKKLWCRPASDSGSTVQMYDGVNYVVGTRGVYLDLNAPERRQQLVDEILMAARRGYKAVYFDETHYPSNGCVTERIIERFKQATGYEVPSTLNLEEPAVRRFMEFTNDEIVDAFQFIKSSVQERFPEMRFVISAPHLSSLFTPRFKTNMGLVADSIKMEPFSFAHGLANDRIVGSIARDERVSMSARMQFGLALARDSVRDGQPPHVWISGTASQAQLNALVGGILALGGIANIDINREKFLVSNLTPDLQISSISMMLQNGKTMSKALSFHKPVHTVGILFSNESQSIVGSKLQNLWHHLIAPAVRVFEQFSQRGVAVGIVTDEMLVSESLLQYSALVIPKAMFLSDKQAAIVSAYKKAGRVVYTFAQLEDPTSGSDIIESLRRGSGVRVYNMPVKAVATHHQKGNSYSVVLSNSFDFIQVNHFNTQLLGIKNEELEYVPVPPMGGTALVSNAPPAPIAQPVIHITAAPDRILKSATLLALDATTSQLVERPLGENNIEYRKGVGWIIRLPKIAAFSIVNLQF